MALFSAYKVVEGELPLLIHVLNQHMPDDGKDLSFARSRQLFRIK